MVSLALATSSSPAVSGARPNARCAAGFGGRSKVVRSCSGVAPRATPTSGASAGFGDLIRLAEQLDSSRAPRASSSHVPPRPAARSPLSPGRRGGSLSPPGAASVHASSEDEGPERATLTSRDDAGALGSSAAPVATGFPEIVFGEGKDAEAILKSLIRISGVQGLAAATRVSPEAAARVQKLEPRVQYDAVAGVLVLRGNIARVRRLPGSVALVAAGTAVPSVVEECRLLLQCLGCYSFLLPESGIMGMHRLVQHLDAVRSADAVIIATGADGSIASVTAGLVNAPVIVLPTSSGYGTAFGGVAPLLGALNAAAPGIAVVNVDSGFGAAMAAWRVLGNASRVRDAVLKATRAKADASNN